MGRDTRARIWSASNTELIALIDLIYEAALDNDLWPGVVIKLADAMGTAQDALDGSACQCGRDHCAAL